jgi:hypothetical protein
MVARQPESVAKTMKLNSAGVFTISIAPHAGNISNRLAFLNKHRPRNPLKVGFGLGKIFCKGRDFRLTDVHGHVIDRILA